jgi:xanthine dehydrogenase accessory factor
VPYVGLVASAKRGAAVRESLEADTSRLRTPAGLDIGARTPEHVALSILAEIVAVRSQLATPAPEDRGQKTEDRAVHHCHHHEHA